MKALRNILDKCLSGLAGLSLIVMTVLTTYQVITRYVFNAPSTWSEELVGYMFGWATMFGAAICTGERAHMNIPIVVDMLKEGPKKVLLIFGEIIALLFSAIILVYGGFTVSSLAMGQQTSSLWGLAVGTFYWVMPVCGIIMTLFAVLNIIGIANGEICLDTADEAAEAIAKVEAEKEA